MKKTQSRLPLWDLSNVYGGLEAQDFQADLQKAKGQLDDLDGFIETHGVGKLSAAPEDLAGAAQTLDGLIRRINDALKLLETLGAFVYSFVATDSYNKGASRRLSEIEQLDVRMKKQLVRLQAYVGSLEPVIPGICSRSAVAQEHRLVLEDLVEKSRYMMETELEDLASELQLSGGGVMWKLQGNVTSQLKMPFERDGETEQLPMTVIRNLAYDPSEEIRRRAYEVELEGWKSIREPVAFSLNCVKGAAVTLARRRGHDDVLDAACKRNRIDRETLDALLGSIREAFPVFRRYLSSKARKLGKSNLPWWDLFAPVGKLNLTYSWEEATDFIEEQFGRFSQELTDFAHRAFQQNWIDAEPRDGKRGGAFCMGLPKVEESRILANFDGSFDGMITLAHELGHGFHSHCQKGLPRLRSGAPMCLAETASIFCETLVFEAALKSAAPEAQLSILDNQLLGATQVTVDIFSRFLFESEVIKRREKAELSADDFCEIILDAQKQAYGDVLDQNHLHPYMWLLKPHYYYGDLNFYNFPYAFGLLFGLGVYALYQKEGESFIPRYRDLLRNTGAGKAANLASQFGIDIRSTDFWKSSLKVVEAQVDRYCALDGC
ncbi:MAG: M3 family oligoendopeptidase [Candidatus Eisenbacteria sp.]|nr:M3 family oligoendopeptidase [Candidatus Eisenbacteria bacterium]